MVPSHSKTSSCPATQRRIVKKSTTSQHPHLIFHHLPIELVNHILDIAASSSRHSCLDICLVASWTRRIARPHLFHTVIDGFRRSQGFMRQAAQPPYPTATDSQLTAGSLVSGIWSRYRSNNSFHVFKSCDNVAHLALDTLSWQWLSNATMSRNQNVQLLVIDPGGTPETLSGRFYGPNVLARITHLRITIVDRYNTVTHLDNFSSLTHFSVSYCLGGTHDARELANLITLPSLMMLVVALSVQAARRGHWKKLGKWVRKTRETDRRVYIVEGCGPAQLQEEWEDEVRGGESIWDRAVRYTRDWERTLETA